MAFESYDCTTCGESFKAYPESNAANGPYCSPSCETEDKGLA